MIIEVPTAQLCIQSESPDAAVHVVQKTPYEVMQEIGPVLMRAYGIEVRGPPLAA